MLIAAERNPLAERRLSRCAQADQQQHRQGAFDIARVVPVRASAPFRCDQSRLAQAKWPIDAGARLDAVRPAAPYNAKSAKTEFRQRSNVIISNRMAVLNDF